jgi:di/tricarboxylate transporter
MTALGTVLIPNTVVVVLMAPIALSASAAFELAPSTAMMAVAVAASATLLSPISHPANVLVMGPGDYRFLDYLKLGLPLTALNVLVILLLLPLLWPVR